MEMLYLVLGALIYAFGVQHGKAFAENKKVNLVPNPARTFKEYVKNKETEKVTKQTSSSIENLLAYTGEKQEKVGG